MVDGKFITTVVEEKIAVVTLNNPPVNVLTEAVLEELSQTFAWIERDPGVRAVIFTTAGTQAFIAGADIKVIAGIQSKEQAVALARRGHAILNQIENSEKINIAAVHGVCVGGGNELIMAFHLRIASERAKFGQPEISLGIIPGFGGTQRLPRIVGEAKALELILTGDVINAQEAYRIGLVQKVVPDGEVLKQAKGLLKRIVSKGATSVRLAKRATSEGLRLSLPEALQLEAELFGEVAESEDKKEGVQAFLEKRQAKFKDA